MKELKNKWSRALMVLFVMMAAFSTSCSNDDDDDNKVQTDSYVGKWSSDTTDSSGAQVDYVQTLTLTKNSFEGFIKTQNDQGEWEDSFALKGNMTVNGNKMNVHISEFGTTFNPITGENTNTITFYTEGSLIFETLMESSGREKDFQSEYSVNGNKLTLMTDMNDDNDYNDVDETMVYTRQ